MIQVANYLIISSKILKKMRNMEITYSVIIGVVPTLITFITMWSSKSIPKNQKYFWTSIIITIVLVGIAFVYLNDKINSLNR